MASKLAIGGHVHPGLQRLNRGLQGEKFPVLCSIRLDWLLRTLHIVDLDTQLMLSSLYAAIDS